MIIVLNMVIKIRREIFMIKIAMVVKKYVNNVIKVTTWMKITNVTSYLKIVKQPIKRVNAPNANKAFISTKINNVKSYLKTV